MPYLNWKGRKVQKQIDPHADARSSLVLSITPEQRGELVPLLQGVFAQGGSELRLDLPDNWIIFWKTRESESRLLLAHPQREEWVTTVALEPGHGCRVIERIESLGVGDSFGISEQGAIGSVSNVEVIISLIAE